MVTSERMAGPRSGVNAITPKDVLNNFLMNDSTWQKRPPSPANVPKHAPFKSTPKERGGSIPYDDVHYCRRWQLLVIHAAV